jgi:hypothetical protein
MKEDSKGNWKPLFSPGFPFNSLQAPKTATVRFAPSLTAANLDYWSRRAQEISNDFCAGLPVTFSPEIQK